MIVNIFDHYIDYHAIQQSWYANQLYDMRIIMKLSKTCMNYTVWYSVKKYVNTFEDRNHYCNASWHKDLQLKGIRYIESLRKNGSFKENCTCRKVFHRICI